MPAHPLKPVIAAPMAGGASNPGLVVEVGEAGGVGFLAGGYKTPEGLQREIRKIQSSSGAPFGVNLFVPSVVRSTNGPSAARRQRAVSGYAKAIRGLAATSGADLGTVNEADDDSWLSKVDVVESSGCPLISFTFGIPPKDVLRSLSSKNVMVVLTVTCLEEARAAISAGADALCVQGPGAGGHRGTHDPRATPPGQPLAYMIRQLASTGVPLIATGGVGTPEHFQSLIGAGAAAVQLGTLFLPTPESGANIHHKAALTAPWALRTKVTRAFTGRYARGIENAFIDEFDDIAPAAYPEIHQLTQPMRAMAAKRGEIGNLALWAGTGYRHATPRPAAEVVGMVSHRSAS